tara:strand:+ start:5864 stop:6757 length:894 start_codon:yes stop_codon:yes gene_type:complete
MKAVLLGLGAMGQRHHKALLKNNRVGEVITVDPNPAVSAQYLSVSAAIAEHEFDFGVVASPTTFHEENACTLLEAGIPLLIEKPLAASVAAAAKIASVAKDRDCKVAVGHIERFNPAIRALMADLTEQPYSVILKRLSPFPARIKDVGVALDLSIHDIDLARHITGAEVVNTRAHIQRNRNKCEDMAVYLIELDNGGCAVVHTSWMSPRRQREAEVTTASAVYEVDMLRQQAVKYTDMPDACYGVSSLFVSREDQLGAQLDTFIEYLLTDDPSNLCLLADGITALRIVEDSLNESLH